MRVILAAALTLAITGTSFAGTIYQSPHSLIKGIDTDSERPSITIVDNKNREVTLTLPSNGIKESWLNTFRKLKVGDYALVEYQIEDKTVKRILQKKYLPNKN